MSIRKEILISGFGGQGVVRLGQIIGLAAVKQNYRVTMLKSHGTEQRGGYVRAQVVVSDEPVDSPIIESPDYFCALSSSAYTRFINTIKDGIVFYDPGTVDITEGEKKRVTHFEVPAKDIAIEKLSQPIYANTIMLGAMAKKITIFDKGILLDAMLETMPRFKDENAQAFDIGYQILK